MLIKFIIFLTPAILDACSITLLSSLLFSALHLQFYGFFPRFFLGVFFGYLFYWSGSLMYPVIAHALNNFLRTRIENPKAKNLIQLVPQGTDKGNIRRADLSMQPGGEQYSRKGSIAEFKKSKKTQEFLNSPIIQTYDDAVVEKFFYEIHRDTVNPVSYTHLTLPTKA